MENLHTMKKIYFLFILCSLFLHPVESSATEIQKDNSPLTLKQLSELGPEIIHNVSEFFSFSDKLDLQT